MKQPFTPQKQILSCYGRRIAKYSKVVWIVLLMSGSYFVQAQTTNNALDFDGIDDNVSLASLPISGNNARTVEGWVKTSVTGVNQNPFASGNASNSEAFNIKITNFGTLGLMGFGNDYYPSTGAILNDGKWHHFAVSYDGSIAKGYVDGNLDWTTPLSLNTSGNDNYIGQSNHNGAQQYFNGLVDELRVWNVERTADEIANNINVKPNVGQAGLVAYYDFDQGIASGNNTTITGLLDKSGNGVDGSLNEFALTGAGSNFVASTFATALVAPVITKISSSFSNCLGSTAYLNAQAYGIAFKYQWYKDGSLLDNETLSGLVLSNVSTPSSGSYSVVVSNIIGSVTSSGVVFSISSNCNNALDFDGNDDFVQLPSATYFTNSNFTVEAWVYPKTYNSWSRVIDFSNGPASDNVLLALTDGDSGHPAGSVFNGGNGTNFTATTSLALNQWSHLAIVVNGNKSSIYINGSLNATFIGIGQVNNIARTINYIGKSAWDGDGYAGMILDELKIWNVGLTDDAIFANISKKPAANQAGLLAYYDFDQGVQSGDNTTLTGLIDKSGNGYDGTFNNFSLNGTTSNFVSGAPITTGTGTYAFLPYITASDVNINKTYGDSSFTVSGISSTSPAPFSYTVLGTSISISGTSSSTVGINIVSAGNAILRISQSAGGDFASGYTDINITVNQLYLEVKAFDFFKIYDNPNPDVFTGTVVGLLNGDVVSVTYSLDGNQIVPSVTGAALVNYDYEYYYGTYFSTSLVANTLTQLSGQNAKSIASGDLNGDGFKDLAVAFENSNNILVYTNTGTGSFTAIGSYTTGYYPQSIAIGDLNNDGFLDLAVANYYSVYDYNNDRQAGPTDHSVSVFTNTGTGSFGTKVDFAVGGTYPRSIAIGDVNGDGKLDIATANSGSANVAVLTNTGLGDFGDPITYDVGSNPYSITFGDLNGDNKLDLVVANYSSNTLSVLTNTGSGSFDLQVTYATGSRPYSVAIGDLNGDTFPDLAVVNSRNNSSGNSVSVLTNTGTGSFGSQVSYGVGSSPYSVVIGDINGDGKLDLAVANANNSTVSVLTNTGTGSFSTQKTYNTGSTPYSLAMADLNGDNKLDLAVANYDDNYISIILNAGDGNYNDQNQLVSNYTYNYLAISDLNSDGKQDLIVVNSDNNMVSVKLGLGNNTYAKDVSYATGGYPVFVAVGDLNGDGKPDLAISNNNDYTISVLTNTGNGSFGSQINYATGSCPYGLAIGDLNGDSFPDIVVTNNCQNTISVLTNTGTGTFGDKVDYTTGSNPISIAVSDLNSDGFADLAVVNNDDNTLSVLTNTGTGSFGDQITYNTGSNPQSIAIGDLNADGFSDLAVANYYDGYISVFTNTGTGSFGDQMEYSTDYYQSSVAIGDLNGDNKPELVVSHQNYNRVSVFNNTGSGFEDREVYNVNAQQYDVAIGDLNGDGRLDLAGATGNSIFTLLNATSYFQTIVGFDLPTSIMFEGVQPLLFVATATSGLPVTYGSSNNIVISVTGAIGTVENLGVVTLTAYQIGSGFYNAVSVSAVVSIVSTPPTAITTSDLVSIVKIYPNPSTGKFTVKGASSVLVYDMIGNPVAKTENEILYISTRGLYIAEAQTTVGKKFIKLIVE